MSKGRGYGLRAVPMHEPPAGAEKCLDLGSGTEEKRPHPHPQLPIHPGLLCARPQPTGSQAGLYSITT